MSTSVSTSLYLLYFFFSGLPQAFPPSLRSLGRRALKKPATQRQRLILTMYRSLVLSPHSSFSAAPDSLPVVQHRPSPADQCRLAISLDSCRTLWINSRDMMTPRSRLAAEFGNYYFLGSWSRIHSTFLLSTFMINVIGTCSIWLAVLLKLPTLVLGFST